MSRRRAGREDFAPREARDKRRAIYAVGLAAIVLLALALRLQGLEWGIPNALHPNYSYHPDEAFTLVWARWLVEGQIIAKHFIYGGTFYYTILNAFVFFGRLWGDSISGANLLADSILVGRYFMVIVAAISILLIFECGRLLYNRNTGLLAALLLAVTPAHVVWAQQVRPDEISAMLTLFALYFAARIMKAPSVTPRRTLIYLGALAGVILAFRFPLVVVCLMPLCAYYFRLRPDIRSRVVIHNLIKNTALAAFATLVVYAVVSPHTFIHYRAAIDGILVTYRYETSIFLDAFDRGPLWYQHLFLSLPQAIGFAGYLLGLAGVAYAVWRRSDSDKIVLAGVLIYGGILVLASWVVVRYALPLVPLLAVLSAHCIVDAAHRFRGKTSRIGLALAAVVTIAWSMVASVAFTRVEASENARDVAVRWIENNIPAKSKILMVQSYLGDDFFNPVLPRERNVNYLVLNEHNDSARFFQNTNYDYVVLPETIYANMERLGSRHPYKQSRIFYDLLTQRYEPIWELKLPVAFAGVDFSSSYRATDYTIVNPGIRVYRNRDLHPFDKQSNSSRSSP